MKRLLVLGYGAACYAMFLGVFLYAIGFIGGFGTPTRLDAISDGGSPSRVTLAVLINVLLIAIFGLQHSLMARPAFKRLITRWIPEPMERSTYVLASNVVMGLLFWLWQPLGGMVWLVESEVVRAAIWVFYGLGWLTVFVSTCLINHFDLFGLRQSWLYFRSRPNTPLPFTMPGPYRLVRHPLYVGWLMVVWATPTMSIAHFMFAIAVTAYILVAIQLEERDLLKVHRDYADYRRNVPMLIPRLFARTNKPARNGYLGKSDGLPNA